MANYTIQYWDGDDIDLEYDDAKHTYMVGERKVPSVTRVVDAVFPKVSSRLGGDMPVLTTGRRTITRFRRPILICTMAYSMPINRSAIGHRTIGLEVHKWIELWIKFMML